MRQFVLVLLTLCFAAQASAQQRPAEPDPKELENIFVCMAAGLPRDWKKTWVVVTETSVEGGTRNFQARFFYSTNSADTKGSPLQPCDSHQVAEAIYALNKYLSSAEQRQWKEAKLQFGDDGSYNLSYDYAR